MPNNSLYYIAFGIGLFYAIWYGKKAKNKILKFQENKEALKTEFLKSKIFKGLKNLNTGFDRVSIYYFSESDFEIILQRVEKYGLGIYGIKPFLNGKYYNVKIHEEINAIPKDPNWYWEAFSEFKKTGEKLQYAATYEIPDILLVK